VKLICNIYSGEVLSMGALDWPMSGNPSSSLDRPSSPNDSSVPFMEGFSSGTHKLIHLIRSFWNKASILHRRIPVHESLFQLIENERMVGRFVEQRQKLIELAGTIGCELRECYRGGGSPI